MISAAGDGIGVCPDCGRQSFHRHGWLERRSETSVRVVGLDDWAWRKGWTYGTIIVDLEWRQVIDLMPDRSAGTTAEWLERHPGIEMISQDHCGSFAQGAHAGAPKARQIADRFHIFGELARGGSGPTQPRGRIICARFVAGIQ